MSKTTTLPFTQNMNYKGITILPADTTVIKALYTASINDAVVKALNIASTDTAIMNVAVWLNDGSTDYLLGTINVPANSGNTGAIIAVDALSGVLIPSLPYDANGKRVLPMKAGNILKLGVLVAVTTAKAITATAFIEEY